MRRYNKQLRNEIDPHYAHEFFLMRKAISMDKYEEIEIETTSKQKIKRLLEHIGKNLTECYDVLVEYLTEKQQKETKDTTVSNTNCLAFLLSRPWAEETTHVSVKRKPKKPSKPKRQVKREYDQRRPGYRNIKPGAEFKLHITFDENKQDSEVSERVVECLNEARIKLEINDELIPLTSCSIKSSSSGSIVIWFKRLRLRVRNLCKTDQLSFITTIIEMIFNHKGVSAVIPRENFKFGVQLEFQTSSEETCCSIAISELIQRFRQFLIEELDGLKLLAHFRGKSLLSSDEECFILKQTSRRSRSSAILDILLGKGPSDLEDFRSYLEEYANSIYVLIWPSKEKETERYITSLALDLDQRYPELIETVQPSMFLKFDKDLHMPRSLVDELLRNPNRNDRAKLILQHFLCQNMSTRRQFIQMLLFYHQLNRRNLQRPQPLQQLVYKKRNITKVRRSKLTRVHAASDRLPVQLGQFCLKSEKAQEIPWQNIGCVETGTPLSHVEKSSDSACYRQSTAKHESPGKNIKESSISSTHIVRDELDVTMTPLEWCNGWY